ncbi:GAF domain-containing protein [Paenibacillus sp. P26]|nr:GAF domain-containing protein [Paenibacillus sp. P26]
MCWCLYQYEDGRLKNAVNILNCKRLEDAVELQRGDTWGITHHATVPLQAGDRRFGLLNVAAPGKTHFADEELALLQAVAYQIGGAIERMRLYAAEQRRADLFARVGEFGRSLSVAASDGMGPGLLAERAVALIGEHFDWPVAALFEPAPRGGFALRAVHAAGRTSAPLARVPQAVAGWLRSAVTGRRCAKATGAEAAALAGRRGLQARFAAVCRGPRRAGAAGRRFGGRRTRTCREWTEWKRRGGSRRRIPR